VSGLLERFFNLKARGTTAQREVTAGVVTFLTMAYIIAVNPLILDAALKNAGVPIAATVAGTCLAAAIPTLAMGLWANFPLALAPGMGLNAFLTYTLILGMGIRWQTAMGIVFVEGVIIALLVLVGLREALMRAIPGALKTAIGSGIGLFIAFIGLQNAGWVVKSDATMVAAGSFHAAGAVVSAAGVLVTAALMMRRVKGALLLGVIATTVFAGIATLLGTKMLTAPATVVAVPDFSTFGKLDIMGALSLKFAAVIFAFMMSDFFDTMGTVVAVGRAAHLEDDKGNIPNLNRILLVDSLAASWGGLCSASSSTSYIESGAGIAEGGRTGLTAVITGLFFLAALPFAPVVQALPKEATAPALIVVGFLMLAEVHRLDFKKPEEAFPAFLTLLGIPLTFSIARGIAFGFLAYVVIALLRGHARQIPPLLWAVAALFTLSLAL